MSWPKVRTRAVRAFGAQARINIGWRLPVRTTSTPRWRRSQRSSSSTSRTTRPGARSRKRAIGFVTEELTLARMMERLLELAA